jgi:hypothetical protein
VAAAGEALREREELVLASAPGPFGVEVVDPQRSRQAARI